MTRSRKQPWVPDWIWEAHLCRCSEIEEHFGKESARKVEAFQFLLLDSKTCESVWKAIDKRRGKPTRLWAERHQDEVSDSTEPDRDDALRFFEACLDAVQWVPPSLSLPQKQVSDHAAKIAKLTSKLREELRGWDELTEHSLPLTRPRLVRLPRDTPVEMQKRELFGSHASRIYAARLEQKGLDPLLDALTTVQERAERWAAPEKLGRGRGRRPNSQNLRRRHFKDAMEEFFRMQYHEKLQQVTRDLACCIFDEATGQAPGSS